MRKRILTIAMICGLSAWLAGVTAFARQDRLTANIPFEFIAGKTTLPAGEYTIEREASWQRDLLLIRGVDNRRSIFILSEATTTRQTPSNSELVFNKIGDEYFLSKIWVEGEDTGREIPKPRAERELENRMAQNGQQAKDLISQVVVRLE